jgi:hypothetical protein
MWGRLWEDAKNTGILTRDTPAFDADILYEEAAIAVENFIRERFEERGYFLPRIGKAPKRAIPFRTDVPFDKITVNLTRAGYEGLGEKIEFLADGQQIVVDGIHPDTGKPYSWPLGDPANIKREDLPYISAEEAQQLVDDVVELLIRDFGYVRAAERPKRTKGNGHQIVSDQIAKELDWQVLVGGILKGERLHDNILELTAKFVASGMNGGAAVNLTRALMELSAAPRDDRWEDRFSDIVRAVQTALDKGFAPEEEDEEEEQPATASPPPGAGTQPGSQPGSPPPPPPPGAGPQPGTPPPGAGSQSGSQASQQPGSTATPHVWREPNTIPPRDFLYDHHIIRGYVSGDVSMGGVGKTSEAQVEIIAMVTGRDLLGVKPKHEYRVWYINLEDPQDEIDRRFAAIFKHYKITEKDLGNRLFTDSGRKKNFIVAREDRTGGIRFDQKVIADITDTIRANAIDCVVIDPYVNSARFAENDNNKMAAIIETVWAAIAERQNCAILLLHHVRKGGAAIMAIPSRTPAAPAR